MTLVSVHQTNASSAVRWEGHMADDVGATYGPEPLAFLSATAEELFLGSSRGQFRLPRASIKKVGRGNMYPWCFCAVRLHHTVDGVPAQLQFKPLGVHWREVLAQLHGLGYPRG
jgi:hypothetical protein